MSNLRTANRLLILGCQLILLAMTGCSTMPGSRLGSTDSRSGLKTFLAIGDKQLPVSSGEPGSTIAADTPEPSPARRASNADQRVSGRVFDGNGEPVDGATVRLAVNAAPGGRVNRVTTDPTGGFTLRGLRPGSSYTLIAEWEGADGPMSGRVEAKTYDTDLKITLAPLDSRSDDGSRGPRVNRVSDQTDIPPEERVRSGSRKSGRSVVNEEDLPPAIEADAMNSPVDQPGDAGVRAPRRWEGGDRQPQTERDETDPAQAAPRALAAPDAEDDGPNPLPPAIEPAGARNHGGKELSSRAASRSQTSEALAERDPEDPLPAAKPSGRSRRQRKSTTEVAKQDDDTIPGALVVVPETFAPVVIKDSSPEADPEPSETAPVLRKMSSTRSNTLASRKTSKPAVKSKKSPRPTWGQVTAGASQPPPLEGAEGVEEVAEKPPTHFEADDNAPDWTKPQSTQSAAEPDPSAEKERMPVDPVAGPIGLDEGPPALRDDATALCDYDERHRQINDFRLPDLQGRPVRFKDLDADLVLLDFWGTWCWPCLKSIPSLVELQTKFPGKKLKVVGIACEQGDPSEAAKNVAAAADRLNINYPVLLSRNDGSCPVQSAFHIGAFPTLVLVDREGKVLWKDQGVTPASLARLERLVSESQPPPTADGPSQALSRNRAERSDTLQ